MTSFKHGTNIRENIVVCVRTFIFFIVLQSILDFIISAL